ncbi:MAG: hypothetical protein ACOVQ0_13605, partial [Novosphingobium sp.]|uniref:hypothetical protein n=1 Tax=Novosphingobium sp. TaxID=1874826 RepID=UPI003B9CF97A
TDIGSATSGLDTSITGTTATLGTVSAGGNYTVATTGAITLGKSAGQSQSAKGAVSLTSSGGAIQQGANGLTLTANSDGTVTGAEALTLNAKTGIALAGATLNGGSAKQSAVSLTSGADTLVGSVLGASLVANAGGAFEARGAIDVVNDAAITAVGAITLNGAVKAGNAVNLKASNAAIGADVTTKTITVFNSGAATGKLAIGDGVTTTAADFALSRAEAARLKASDTLTLGSDAAHNVEIGGVEFSVPKTVIVPTSGKRIDVTGRIVFDGDTTLKLGSSGTTIIQLSTTKGGSIASDGGVLELSAANIVSGADDFAADLSAVTGSASSTGSRDAAFAMNINPGSKLYSPTAITNETMIDVGSMKVTFSGFAMFQNTGTSLIGTGVALGNGNPTSIALDIANTSTQPVFAAFGSINGIINAATALLGNPPLAHYDNVSASRINGCVIGGGNCQSVQNLTPALNALDNIRTTIFTVKPDFQVPFDPLVGTNNDALFDDVGSFGLGELPMTPIECSDPNGICETQKKGGN